MAARAILGVTCYVQYIACVTVKCSWSSPCSQKPALVTNSGPGKSNAHIYSLYGLKFVLQMASAVGRIERKIGLLVFPEVF